MDIARKGLACDVSPVCTGCRTVGAMDRLLCACGKTHAAFLRFPPGHFYSPVPCPDAIDANAQRIFDASATRLPGIDLRVDEQLKLLRAFQSLYAEQPFADTPGKKLRYGFDNDSFSYADALFYHCMLRHVRPKRVVEIGSGHSTCVLLDTNDLFFHGSIDVTCIEPFPDVLLPLLREDDRSRFTLLQEPLQNVSSSVLTTLEAGDVLFIDSSHVCKAGSDVQFLFTEVLPRLQSGVFIHFHDIFWPFEYPRAWIDEGRFWNEAYVLRAFLTQNPRVRIVLFNHYLATQRPDAFGAFPLAKRNTGGSLWLETTQ